MIDNYSDPIFLFAKNICNDYSMNCDPILSSLDLYLQSKIDCDQFLQVLQWLPEEPRIELWNMYKRV